MCCGQKRADLKNTQTQMTAGSGPQPVSNNSRVQAVRTPPSASSATQTASRSQPVTLQSPSIGLQAATTTLTPHSRASVRYLEKSPIRVRGLVTGMSYEFSGSHPVQQVDSRDAPSLLNTRFFRRA